MGTQDVLSAQRLVEVGASGAKNSRTAETTQAAPYFIFKNFSRIFLFWLPSDLQAGPAPNIPRLGYDTLYLASGCYADHIASV